MEFAGHIQGIARDFKTNKYLITLLIDEGNLNEFQETSTEDKLSIVIKKFMKKRSLDANALLWKCLSEIAMKEGTDKWDLYLEKIKAHGKCYANTIDTRCVESMKSLWREMEVIDTFTTPDGVERSTCLMYPGSSTYTVEEFSNLLNHVIDDMDSIGLQPPTSKEMQRSLELWEKRNTQH